MTTNFTPFSDNDPTHSPAAHADAEIERRGLSPDDVMSRGTAEMLEHYRTQEPWVYGGGYQCRDPKARGTAPDAQIDVDVPGLGFDHHNRTPSMQDPDDIAYRRRGETDDDHRQRVEEYRYEQKLMRLDWLAEYKKQFGI